MSDRGWDYDIFLRLWSYAVHIEIAVIYSRLVEST